ncbi:MAG: hypothetical protein R3C05_11975 [Pirellulaceae bacterium]
MCPSRFCRPVAAAILLVILCGQSRAENAVTTVALTTTIQNDDNAQQQCIVNSFLDLLESQVSQLTSVSIVQRMQLDVVMRGEQILSNTLALDRTESLQFGKLMSADLIVIPCVVRNDAFILNERITSFLTKDVYRKPAA